MKYKVNLIIDAEEDLFEIYKYVYLNDSEDKAETLYSKLKVMCNSLENYAERGHVVDELSELGISDFYEIHFKPYRIIYQIIKDAVYVHCILDGRRDMQRLLQERLIRNIK
ncbi:MAG: plasmid stabilization protein [Melioribacteraceae bacterium]|nr:MAG: plasmid stabilization protein [Melioribacteraceae bacterium]